MDTVLLNRCCEIELTDLQKCTGSLEAIPHFQITVEFLSCNSLDIAWGEKKPKMQIIYLFYI